MRSILVQAGRGDDGRFRVETALSLARMTGGHVSLLVDTPVARYTAADSMGGSMLAVDAMREALADDDAYAASIKDHMSREDVACDVLRSEAEAGAALAETGRLADIIIVSRADAVATDLPLSVRAPVLALNEAGGLDFPLESVAIAWDGSSPASYALRCSLPLLAGCPSVTVLTVAGRGETNDLANWPATDAAAYLSRHGISAELKVLERQGGVEETLAHEFAVSRPSLVVIGAFGHSRLREFLFGGVTNTLLSLEGGPPLLLAH
ncbi:MAG: universal stress protein [Novosphingobium sp.]